MQGRNLVAEDGKVAPPRSAPRILPSKILKFLLLFVALAFAVFVLIVYTSKSKSLDLRAIMTRPPAAVAEPCERERAGLARWLAPPRSTMHNMSDQELFWVASFDPMVKKHPFKRVPKIAFMFLTRGPLPLAPLWEKFFAGHEGRYSIYVHSLPGYRPEFAPTSVFYRRQVPSQVAQWGKMSMCDAERRLLANALLDMANERFVLLSESCIPLYNFGIAYQYLIKSKYSFVGSFDEHSPHGRGRYNLKMLPEVHISQWRKGAQWFEVNRKLALDIITDTKYYPKFRDFCKPACYVDEHYFPTMLSIESPRLIANRSVTWVDWSRGGAHPATFGGGDITEAFINRITEGQKCLYNDQQSEVCFLFARKFSPSTLEPLLHLAPN